MDSTPGSGFSKQSEKVNLSSGYAFRQPSGYHKNSAYVILPFVPAIPFLAFDNLEKLLHMYTRRIGNKQPISQQKN